MKKGVDKKYLTVYPSTPQKSSKKEGNKWNYRLLRRTHPPTKCSFFETSPKSTFSREGFLDSLPPLIEFSVTGGPWTLGRWTLICHFLHLITFTYFTIPCSETNISRAGQLIVRPGSIVHLDCIQVSKKIIRFLFSSLKFYLPRKKIAY